MKARGKFSIELRVRAVALERYGILDFARHGPDVNVDAEPAQSSDEFGIKIGHRHRGEREAFRRGRRWSRCEARRPVRSKTMSKVPTA